MGGSGWPWRCRRAVASAPSLCCWAVRIGSPQDGGAVSRSRLRPPCFLGGLLSLELARRHQPEMRDCPGELSSTLGLRYSRKHGTRARCTHTHTLFSLSLSLSVRSFGVFSPDICPLNPGEHAPRRRRGWWPATLLAQRRPHTRGLGVQSLPGNSYTCPEKDAISRDGATRSRVTGHTTR